MKKNSFFKLKVKEISNTTSESVVITFEIPERLKSLFQFKAGQHLTVRKKIKGTDVRRSYSLCTSPGDSQWKVAVRKLPGGLLSTLLNESLQPGDQLEVMPPSGRFSLQNANSGIKGFVAFAAGSGITPIISIIKDTLTANPQASFQLFYFNRFSHTIMLKEELESLKNQFMDRFEVFYFLTREARDIPLFNGRISNEKLDSLFNLLIDKDNIHGYFICGPKDMIFLISDYLTDRSVDKNNIHFELFYAGDQNEITSIPAVSNKDKCEVIINEGGKSFSYSTGLGKITLLDSALAKNANLPFACKGGVCCTCRAKLLEGKVEMITNYALEQDEIDQGYILACQSVPLSKKIVVDFD